MYKGRRSIFSTFYDDTLLEKQNKQTKNGDSSEKH